MASRLVVVKAGTSSITTPDGKLDEEEMVKLADQIAEVMEKSNRIILVTSGAVAAGIAAGLGIPRRPQP